MNRDRQNPFAQPILAVDAYDRGRPRFHSIVFERVRGMLAGGVRAALDVACGTGQSTMALAAVSGWSVGLDSSGIMLEQARSRGSAQFVRGLAERLPFTSQSFDLVAVGLGLHWFDRSAFLNEVDRVLRSRGWLLIYDSGLCTRMRENVAFGAWAQAYRGRFPAPPRDDRVLDSGTLQEHGLIAVSSDRFVHAESYDLARLMDYMRTQSNVLMAPRHDPQATSAWLKSTLQPLFPSGIATMEYDAWSDLYQKS